MASEQPLEEVESSSSKRPRLSPAPSTSGSWTPSVSAGPEAELESCDSGLSDSASGVTTPPVEAGLEAEARPGVAMEDDEDSLSGLSDLSGQDWKPDMSSKLSWLHAAMRRGENPKDILENLLPSGSEIPDSLDNMTMWKVLFNLLSEPPRRKKLETLNTLQDCVEIIRKSRNIIILTGAGVSVSCGIPDFRSRDGVYARLAADFPDLPDPQSMFDIQYFKKDPRPFFKFAREIYPGQFQPSPCHKFIRCVESNGKLLKNYTQNIDTLEQVAGIGNVIQCHGSFATASCMACKRKVDAEVIREDIFNQTIPKCGRCPEPESESGPEMPALIDPPPPPVQMPVMKPDIVFFGEGLPDHFHECISRDKSECDLLIVIGSSLKVRPVALIPSSLPPEVPQILINREPLPHLTFDVELLGDCDRIVNQLCLMLADECWAPPIHSPLLSQHTGMPIIPSSSEDNTAEDFKDDENVKSSSQMQEEAEEKLTDKDNNTDCKSKNDEKENSVQGNDLTSEPSTSKNNDEHNENPNKGDESDDEGEEWKVKSLSDYIPEGQFLFLPPSRYVFPGAELYPDPDSSDDEEDDDLEGSERDGEEDGETGEHEVVSDPPCLEPAAEAAPQLNAQQKTDSENQT